jgi:hypothetical protein
MVRIASFAAICMNVPVERDAIDSIAMTTKDVGLGVHSGSDQILAVMSFLPREEDRTSAVSAGRQTEHILR